MATDGDLDTVGRECWDNYLGSFTRHLLPHGTWVVLESSRINGLYAMSIGLMLQADSQREYAIQLMDTMVSQCKYKKREL